MARKKMRGRSRMKNLKIIQEHLIAPVLASILMLLVCSSFVIGEPGYLDFDNLPETKFTCAGKVIGGYYADLETSCQMFHVCTIGQLDEPMDIKFLCLNGTVFDQETRVCERVDEVDCSKSEKFYYLNLELYGNTMVPIADEETSEESAIITSTELTTPSTTTTTTNRPVTRISMTTVKPTTNSNYFGTTTIPPQSQLQATTQLHPQDEKPTRSTFTTFNTTNSNGQNIMGFASSTIHPSHHLSHSHQQHHQYIPSSTHKPIMQTGTSNGNINNQQQISDDDEYEYEDEEDDSIIEDDYLAEQNRNHDESGAHNLHQPQQQKQKFSPHHFIYQQQQQQQQQQQPSIVNKNVNSNNNNNNQGSGAGDTKSAISFQQQQFQSGDSLSVTVTTHSAGNTLNQKEQPLGGGYNYNTQVGSKRIPLLPPPSQQQFQPPSGHPGLHPLPPFRLRGQGFKLPQQYQPQPFDGYRRTSPQIPLHLPFEQNRNQKELLGFEDNSADDLIAIQKERKDLKRSDTLVSQSQLNLPITTTTSTTVSTTTIAETTINNSNDNQNTRQQHLSSNSNTKTINNYRDIKKVENFQNRNNSSSRSSNSSSINFKNNFNNSHNSNISSMNNSNNSINNNNYDKVLLTPQNRYIPTLPKVIITASASVSDASGKKLNYSLGNVLGKTIKIAPSTYDEYKEDDVALDPFFLDVPKIRPRIKRRK